MGCARAGFESKSAEPTASFLSSSASSQQEGDSSPGHITRKYYPCNSWPGSVLKKGKSLSLQGPPLPEVADGPEVMSENCLSVSDHPHKSGAKETQGPGEGERGFCVKAKAARQESCGNLGKPNNKACICKRNCKPIRAGLKVFNRGHSWLVYIPQEPVSPLKFLDEEDGVSGEDYIKEQVFNTMKWYVLEANIFQKWLPAYIESFAHNRCPFVQ